MPRQFTGTGRVSRAGFTWPTIYSATWWAQNPGLATEPYMLYSENEWGVYHIADREHRIDLNFVANSGVWGITAAVHAMTLAGWNHYAVVHDASSQANVPVFYANGVPKTVVQRTGPAATFAGSSQALVIGNTPTGSTPIGGAMAEVGVHNVLLTQAEVLEAMWRGFTPRGRMITDLLDGESPTKDLSGNARDGTVTGTTVVAGPSIPRRLVGFPSRPSRALVVAPTPLDVAPATSYSAPPGVDPAASGDVTLDTAPATSYAAPPGVDPLDLGTLLDLAPATSYAEPPGVDQAASGTAPLAVAAASSYAAPPGLNLVTPQVAEPRRPAGPLPWMVFGGVEIGNARRTMAYLLNPYDPETNPGGIAGIPTGAWGWRIRDFDCCSCPVLATDGAGNPVSWLRPDDIGVSLGDPAPWYDPGVPESAQFLGVLITEISGLDSTVQRAKVERAAGLGGAALGAQRSAGREVGVKAVLVATSCPGLDYGKRWLSHALANDLCSDCETYQLELRTTCPPDERPDVGLANLYEVALAEGPKVVTGSDLPDCCDLLEVEWTMLAGNPLLYACPTQVTPRTLVADAGGQVIGTVDPPEPFGTISAQVEIETGTVAGQGVLLRAWDQGLSDPCPGPDGEECLSIRLAGLPAGVKVRIDGARQRLVLVDLAGDESDGLPYVVMSDGQAFDWPEFVGCQRVCVAVSVFADPGPGAPVGASVTIASQHRFLA